MKHVIQLSNKWCKPKEAKTWPEGCIVLVHRPFRKPSHHGYLEVDTYFRPDLIDELTTNKVVLFMKAEVASISLEVPLHS